MKKVKDKRIIMKAEPEKGTRLFSEAVLLFSLLSLHLFLVSASENAGAAEYLSVLVGLAVAGTFLIFGEKKFVKIGVCIFVAAYTTVCVAAFFRAFASGAVSFWNGVAFAANTNLHYGFVSFDVVVSPLGSFLFMSVLSAWFSLAAAALCFKNKTAFAITVFAAALIMLSLGLFPKAYAAVLFAVALVAVPASDSGFSWKAAVCYLSCAAVLFAAALPCFLLGESRAVKNFKESAALAVEMVLYGKDSLPEGRLDKSAGMRSSDEVMLQVRLASDTPKLYLKGFVGGDWKDNRWNPTDKNAYVSSRYRGLMEYISVGGLPVRQYAQYSALSGNSALHTVSVKNVGANRKYVYAPYTTADYSAGAQYYDLGLRANVFSPKEYTFEVFAGDKSSERVTQAQWVLENINRTPQMIKYLALEGEYRNFVSDVYTKLDPETASAVGAALNGFETNSINTATQFIRAYFSDGFTYSDESPDETETDFAAEFFGGKITKANSAYFATAATFAFRSFGFAARYAEGYLVSADEEHGGAVAVTGDNAHAWTEVYFDGIGWLPIEVTPTFFSDDDPDTPIDPDNPDNPDKPVDPDPPPEIPVDPTDPEEPELPIRPPLDEKESRLFAALKILIAVSATLSVAAFAVLALVVRREITVGRKRKSLDCNGESFGKAAYEIVKKDCKSFGGFDEKTLEAFGVCRDKTARFRELVRRAVYGGTDLTVGEKYFVTEYIETVAASLSKGGKIKTLYCKYVKCLGI